MFIVLIIEGSKLPMKSFISIWGVIKQGSGVVSLGAEQLFPNCLITRVPGHFAKCGVLSPTLEIWFIRWWGKGQGGGGNVGATQEIQFSLSSPRYKTLCYRR